MPTTVRREMYSREWHERRALAAYYRSGGAEHPDHNLTRHYVIDRNPNGRNFFSYALGCNKYIKLANESGTLAVFVMYDKHKLRRLERWPEAVENGTAETESKMWEDLDAELDAEIAG